MKNAWNQEINLKKKGKRDLPASKDKNLAKILKENDKKWMVEPRANAEREKSWKLFEKVQSVFLKTWFTSFDRSKISLNWSKQTETPSLKFKKFWSIEKQIGPIELGRGSPYFWGKNTIFDKQDDLTQNTIF